jgi:tRNA(His) 5'-end guanylyltransferase
LSVVGSADFITLKLSAERDDMSNDHGALQLVTAALRPDDPEREMQSLHERMKRYEAMTEDRIDPDLPWIVRADGKAFHTWTKGLERPCSASMLDAMNYAAVILASYVQGVAIGYVQSDEITVIVPARSNPLAEPWFGGKVQKIVSVAAACCAAAMTRLSTNMFGHEKDALFDARVFNVPSASEAVNCLLWRQQDAIRNSIQACGQAVFSHKQLQGKDTAQIREMLTAAGKPWEGMNPGFMYGRVVTRESFAGPNNSVRHRWVSFPAPLFTTTRERWITLLTHAEQEEV